MEQTPGFSLFTPTVQLDAVKQTLWFPWVTRHVMYERKAKERRQVCGFWQRELSCCRGEISARSAGCSPAVGPITPVLCVPTVLLDSAALRAKCRCLFLRTRELPASCCRGWVHLHVSSGRGARCFHKGTLRLFLDLLLSHSVSLRQCWAPCAGLSPATCWHQAAESQHAPHCPSKKTSCMFCRHCPVAAAAATYPAQNQLKCCITNVASQCHLQHHWV